MCNRPISWVPNPAAKAGVGGTHNLRPVMCDEYVSALEEALAATTWITGQPDNFVVNRIRKSLGMPPIDESQAS